ncbi:MAG: glycosyltransferase family 2 protein [Glaciimonas sp.]|nr:glycosyltransferase family 2 protein [Glaciimonas sp.]
MENKIKITAIVPAYNVENYIAAAIDSLLNQTEKFHEIIIVNDGSTDNTGTLIDQYTDIAGIKIFHTGNNGQACARNFSLSQASGDYVYFFDSDDLLNADFVESMQALVHQKPEIDIIYFSGQSFLDDGCRLEYMPSYDRKIDMGWPSGIEATGFMLQRDMYFASPCLYLSKRALWGDNNLSFMNIVHEDEEIIMRLSCSAGMSLCLSKVFFKRRIRLESTMTLPKSKRNAIGYLYTLESIASYCNRNRVQVLPIKNDLVRRFYNILCGYFALCKAIDLRPEYKKLFTLLIELGRFPAPRQLYEMWVPAAFHARLSTVKRKLCK